MISKWFIALTEPSPNSANLTEGRANENFIVTSWSSLTALLDYVVDTGYMMVVHLLKQYSDGQIWMVLRKHLAESVDP